MNFRPDRVLWVSVLATACATDLDPEDQLAVENVERGARPTPGADEIGDPLFPGLGNGGYDVEHYDLDLRYPTAAPDQVVEGTVTITARATQALSRFNLDFAGTSAGTVRVDDCHAQATWQDGELAITPAHPIRRGQQFTVTVTGFTATPRVPSAADFLGAPLFTTADGIAIAAQPAGAHLIFPSNDHPRDKASFSFRIDVPEGTTAVANGELRDRRTRRGRSVWKYEQRAPMATELAQVAVGAFTVIERGRHAGIAVRDVVPTRLLTPELDAKLATVTAHLDFMEERVGDYPFPVYGSLLVDGSLGFALETQTLSLYETRFFDGPAPEGLMVHELAHQWFGDSVAPAQWSDVWQNEGHATWYELDYQVDDAVLESIMQQIYSLGDEWRGALGPVAAPLSGSVLALFNPNVYYGGALALYALRQQVGAETFEQIERAWVSRYRGRSASTEQFIALASEVSGADQSAFLEAWLYGTTTPPMPGHPEWTVDPVPAPAPTARVAGGVRMKSLRLIKH